jgi:hypothetical protein
MTLKIEPKVAAPFECDKYLQKNNFKIAGIGYRSLVGAKLPIARNAKRCSEVLRIIGTDLKRRRKFASNNFVALPPKT